MSPKNDPYYDDKIYHMASHIRSDGHVSALCFKRPRAINLGQALWTTEKDNVTCKKCLRILKRQTD